MTMLLIHAGQVWHSNVVHRSTFIPSLNKYMSDIDEIIGIGYGL